MGLSVLQAIVYRQYAECICGVDLALQAGVPPTLYV